jgi:NAD+ synthase (glutamine-hydrolysing)
MKIALAQVNQTVGDIRGNMRRIREFIARAAKQHADLVVFPEMAVTGYPPRDLLEFPEFIDKNRQAVLELAGQLDKPYAIVGFVDRNPLPEGKRLMNAAALLGDHQVLATRYKSLLPTYDVFDEGRYFAPAPDNPPFTLERQKIGLSICEDMWNDAQFWSKRLYTSDPILALAQNGTDLMINISGSPFHHKKSRQRLDMVESYVRQVHRPFIFVNQVGGNDELVFDGNSFAVDAEGRLLAQAKSFEEDLIVVDTESKGSAVWRQREDIEDVHDALVLGLRDYARRCGFEKVLLGLSGGIDSAVTAALAVEALGKANVLGVSMPSPYSSKGSVTDSQKLAKSLGIKLISVPISSVFSAYKKTLKPAFGSRKPDVTEENLQARIRGTLLMALSNKYNMLLLTTGNKSELSMGYCTLYGDMNGGLAVISDVPKMLVYALGRSINRRTEVIPEACFTKPPSAELRPNQTDQDTLPPYDVLDAIIEAYIEENLNVEEIAAKGHPRGLVQKVLTSIDRAEYKRRQAAPGLRITPKAFGMGRRLPIAKGDFRD